MARVSIASLLLSFLFASTHTIAVAQEPEASGFSPLKKVITLLEEMKAQVSKEAEEDEMAYSKYECWCTTTEKEKTAAVEEASTSIEELTAFLAESVAKEGELKTEIETLTADIAADEDALAEATAIREKEQAAFEAEEADMSETLAALKQAVEVLKGVQLVQKSSSTVPAAETASALVQVKNVVTRRFPQFKDIMQRDLFDVLGSLQGSDAAGESFLPKRLSLSQQDPSGLVGAAAGAKSYNSRSGQIFGVLQEMSDEFERDLKTAKENEAKALATYAALKEAKEGEIAAASKQKKTKETALADLIAKTADAKEEKASLEEAVEADQTFLANLKKGCTKEAEEYKARVAVRSEELQALGEALGVLTEDDARELFGKTMASFLQVSSSSGSSVASASGSEARRQDRAAERAMRRLAAVAKRHKNWSLASLAVRTRLDAFTKVKEAMDKMTAELNAQQKEEYEKKAFCEKNLDTTEDEIKVAKQEESDLSDKHLDISNTLEVLAADMSKLKEDVASMEVSLKQAGEARKTENAVFQTTISDQRATIAILNKALARLKAFYDEKGAASLVEVRVHGRQEAGVAVAPPPPKPKDYEKSAGAGGVLQLMAMIIKDAEAVEIEIEAAEQSAQETYATFAKDTAASIEADRGAIAENEKRTAEALAAKSETEEAQTANADALASLDEVLKAHHLDCDWLLKYYDDRQTARAEELDAIADAKAILSGSDFGKAAEE